ncbi:AAA family ATPase [Ectothiorhodospiraceae bacterium BW-2]|nr:AAA family ATPase [Ectothiorhodospiraceae bacterium BW-2]
MVTDQLIYLAETDFGRVDIYRALALELGLEPAYRRAQLWRDIKQRIEELTTHQALLPIWIIDEAQNLPTAFFHDFPAYINFAFDSKELLTVWFVGHPYLATLLERQPYNALNSRIHVRLQLKPVTERQLFRQLIEHAFESAGASQTLLSDSGIELLHQASGGIPRRAARLLKTSLNLAAEKGMNHLPDELIQAAIEELR